MWFIFTYANYKCQESHFKKSYVITFTWFLTIAQPNIKILLLNSVCVLFFVYSFTTSIPFFNNFKILDFIDIYFWKIVILNFEGQNRQISKIRDGQDCSPLNCTSFGDHGSRFTSNVHILEARKHFRLLTQNRGAWRH